MMLSGTDTNNKVLLAMSGGLDSNMAAFLLQQQGYSLVGITMKTWDYAQSGGQAKETGCCSLDSIHDARQLAVELGFPHYVLDLREAFESHIVKDFVEQYMRGRTPNPCVLCNTFIKWGALLHRADQLGCRYIATGHYARIRKENGRWILSRGLDEDKDQSYVLWGLTQDFLSRTLFPLSDYTKPQIRQMARDAGFGEIADKRESYEICFVPDNDYRGFLQRRVPDLETRVGPGDFVDAGGQVLGRHKGYPFYTVGQRKGLNIAMGEPYYVLEIRPATNTIVVGKRNELYEEVFQISGFNPIKYDPLPADKTYTVKIRYRDPGHPARISHIGERRLRVYLGEAVAAIAPGQSAVLYEGDDVVGGGLIERNAD